MDGHIPKAGEKYVDQKLEPVRMWIACRSLVAGARGYELKTDHGTDGHKFTKTDGA
jgi:hypothetical protein